MNDFAPSPRFEAAVRQALAALLTPDQQDSAVEGYLKLFQANPAPSPEEEYSHCAQIMFLAVAGTLGLEPSDLGFLRARPLTVPVIELLMERAAAGQSEARAA